MGTDPRFGDGWWTQAPTREQIVRGYEQIERHNERTQRERVAHREWIEHQELPGGRIRHRRMVGGRVVEIWHTEPKATIESAAWKPSGRRLA